MFRLGTLASSRFISDGGGETGTAYRYFRFRILQNTGDNFYTAIGEAILAETFGGPQFAVGGTATSSTNRSATYTADKAFDGLTANWWSSQFNVSPPHTLTYDLGPGVTKVLKQYRIGVASNLDEQMDTWFVEGSNDNENWFVLAAEAGRTQAFWTGIGAGNYASFDVLSPGPLTVYNASALVFRQPQFNKLRLDRAEVMVVREQV